MLVEYTCGHLYSYEDGGNPEKRCPECRDKEYTQIKKKGGVGGEPNHYRHLLCDDIVTLEPNPEYMMSLLKRIRNHFKTSAQWWKDQLRPMEEDDEETERDA